MKSSISISYHEIQKSQFGIYEFSLNVHLNKLLTKCGHIINMYQFLNKRK